MKPIDRSCGISSSLLPILAAAGASAAIFLLLSSGLGTKFGLWHFRTGFTLLRYAAYLGLVTSVIALICARLSLKSKDRRGMVLSFIALLFSLLAFGLPYSWKLKAELYPRIHDISTDLRDPPSLSSLDFAGSEVAAEQLLAYPDLKTIEMKASMDQAFQLALETAREMGWEIKAFDPGMGRIEAIDTTFWFGFIDDIAIRVKVHGDHSLVDIRSVSRVGISDVGTNAKRIRNFGSKLIKKEGK